METIKRKSCRALLLTPESEILLIKISPLANAGISIFAISTFDTDYLMVKKDSLDQAVQALLAAGHLVVGYGES